MPDERPDPLETVNVNARIIGLSTLAVVVFLLLSLLVMGVFYRQLLAKPPHPTERAFPEPQLETSIDPRMVPAVQRGPRGAMPNRPAPERR